MVCEIEPTNIGTGILEINQDKGVRPLGQQGLFSWLKSKNIVVFDLPHKLVNGTRREIDVYSRHYARILSESSCLRVHRTFPPKMLDSGRPSP
jgi:hypothetical protein